MCSANFSAPVNKCVGIPRKSVGIRINVSSSL